LNHFTFSSKRRGRTSRPRWKLAEFERDFAEDQAAMKEYVERNREPINKGLKEGDVSGEAAEVSSLDDLISALAALKARRRTLA
jgi:hypothetical protein